LLIVNNDNSNSNNSNNSNSNNSYSIISNSNNSYSNISNVSNSIENNVYVDSSMCEKVFNFLPSWILGGKSINNSTRKWKDLFKCQMKSGAYSDNTILGGYYGSSSIDYTYCYWTSNGLCSIGSNRIVLLLPRASMLKKQ